LGVDVVDGIDCTEATMWAMSVIEPGRAERVDTAEPAVGPGQVRVRVEGCGVCASNLGPWQGLPWIRYPLAPGEGGHEGWGRVEAVGAGVAHLDVGQRVAFLSNRAWAELDVAEETSCVVLPDSIGAFPGEAFGCARNIFRRSRIEPGQHVAIIGIGFLGAALCRLASSAGARVIAISRRASSLALASAMGAEHTVAMDDHTRIIETVRALTEGRLCPRVIECVGLQWPLDLASELCAVRGMLVVAGYHQDGPRQVNLQLWNWKGLDVVNAHERDPAQYVEGITEAVRDVASGRLDPTRLVTHTYRLDELARALDATASKPEGFVKAVVLP
jgi:threonine dehydrogenase-like Zn-dependent dehydrogenase